MPKEARRLWSQCIVQALSEIVRFNDVKAWKDFFMLAKCALRTMARGRRGNHQHGSAETKNLCRRWLEGQRRDLWNQGRAAQQRRSRQPRPSREQV